MIFDFFYKPKPCKPWNPYHIRAKLVPVFGGDPAPEYRIYRNIPLMAGGPQYLGTAKTREAAVKFLQEEYKLPDDAAREMLNG